MRPDRTMPAADPGPTLAKGTMPHRRAASRLSWLCLLRRAQHASVFCRLTGTNEPLAALSLVLIVEVDERHSSVQRLAAISIVAGNRTALAKCHHFQALRLNAIFLDERSHHCDTAAVGQIEIVVFGAVRVRMALDADPFADQPRGY